MKGSAFYEALHAADDQISEMERLRSENASLRSKLAVVESERDTARAIGSTR